MSEPWVLDTENMLCGSQKWGAGGTPYSRACFSTIRDASAPRYRCECPGTRRNGDPTAHGVLGVAEPGSQEKAWRPMCCPADLWLLTTPGEKPQGTGSGWAAVLVTTVCPPTP